MSEPNPAANKKTLVRSVDLSSLVSGSSHANVRFERQMLRGKTAVSQLKITDSQFDHVGFKYASIADSTFERCEFRRVDLRNADLSRVSFIGCRFHDCNLGYTQFAGCTLWYVEFTNCDLNYDGIVKVLPAEHNLRRRLLRSMRTNAGHTGDAGRANELLLLELEAERRDLFDRFVHPSKYYSERYRDADRLFAFGWWIGHWLQLLVWGYGLRLRNLATTALLVLISFALLINLTGCPYAVIGAAVPRALTIGEAFYLSASNVMNASYGEIVPAATSSRVVCLSESMVGIVLWGFFVAAIYRRLAK